ncbi:DUF1993 domain-containing protein [Labrys wisconsinensis]|uniref:DUF1993 domain-containing protein n=1 Tax=Labrys wisconsinensis TaxID=425677 RepID=A0ABU0J1R2_9HYPH|nr:DUF1993 domain-containing protein [Labrys wisconsinensis]MDQ0468187.1 hypothetical protein [Labrys wisconsinensis]
MSISLHEASVPVFIQYLETLSATLGKAAAHAAAKKIDSAVFCQLRLFPDMFPLSRQVQLAADFAKNGASRLAGQEPPRFSDDETALEELQSRITRTLAHVKGLPKAAIDEGGERPITITVAGQPVNFVGRTYLLHFVLPNFFFHVTAVYALLRANGVELSKRDFMGALPA